MKFIDMVRRFVGSKPDVEYVTNKSYYPRDEGIPEIKGEVHMVSHGPDEPGIRPGIHITNGNLILDFGTPIQYLGLTPDDAKQLVGGLAVSAIRAEEQPKSKAH